MLLREYIDISKGNYPLESFSSFLIELNLTTSFIKNASTINILFGRNSFIKNAAIKLTIICVINVAILAPVAPRLGINIQFMMIFAIAPIPVKYLTYLCSPSETIQAPRATPR